MLSVKTPLVYLLRIFCNGAQALIFVSTCLLTASIYSSVRHARNYTTALHSRSITLSDLSQDYIYQLNTSLSSSTPFNYTTLPPSLPDQIPPIIHQTYKTASIPAKWASAHESVKAQNPSYTHYLWTDLTARQFMAEHYAWFLPTYDAYPYPISRVDSIRYFLLWHYGGIYIDLDISCRRPLDPLLAFPAWFPLTQPYGVSNDVMASAPRHPVMGKLALGLMDHRGRYGTGYTTVFWTTGPMFVNGILSTWFAAQSADGGDGRADGVRVLMPMFYDQPPYTFFGHREGSSWHGWDAITVKWLCRRLWWVVGAVSLGACLSLVVVIMRRDRRREKGLLLLHWTHKNSTED